MNRILLTALVAVCLAVTACNDDPVTPATGADVAVVPQMNSDLIVVESVTGNAHYLSETVDRTANFTMRKYDDGSVEGWYHVLRRGPGGADLRVRIECLHVVGNEAWASGTVVDAVGEQNIGKPYSFYFLDNGEGVGAMPDEFAALRFLYFDCETEPEVSPRQLTIGNLQVH
jgi:hypothetical protein